MEVVVGAELAMEAEVGVVEKDAGVEETGVTNGELVKRRPSSGKCSTARGGGG